MFESAGAELLCCEPGVSPGYAITGGAGANLTTVDRRPSIVGSIRDVAFPLVDPYLPVTRTRVPVPGLNAWPGRANRLGRRYYGLGAAPAVTTNATKTIQKTLVKPKRFNGFGSLGAFEPGWDNEVGIPPAMPPISRPSTGGGIDWNVFFGGLFRTVPPAISAVTGRSATPPYVAPSYSPYGSQYGLAPEGYSYNSSGQLIRDASSNVTNFITENPIFVGGAVLGAVLLFMRPPGRR